MSLLTVEEFAAVAPSALSLLDLQVVINREEAELVRRCGAHGDGATPVTETYEVTGADLFLPRAAVSVSAVSVASYVGASPTTLSSSQYYLVAGQSRVRFAPFLTGAFVTVTYVPQDDRPLRKQVLIDLVRIAIERGKPTGTIEGNGYRVTRTREAAADTEAERERLYRRLTMQAV